jgi:O-antigen ligase
MVKPEVEKRVSQLAVLGIPFVTLFIWSSGVTDPVNATKLFIAGGVGFGMLALFLCFNLRETFDSFKSYVLAVLVFILAMGNAAVASNSPFTQNIYGSYGRNTGLLTYFILSCVALGMLNISSMQNFNKLIIGLQFAGLINVLYCGWVLAFGDFIGWNNPYGDILGLFGNPNFISSFLGIFIGTLFVNVFNKNLKMRYRVGAIFVIIIAFFEIIKSHSVQGIIVSIICLGVVLFFVLRERYESLALQTAYLLFSGLISLVAVFGALQKGPMDFIYKTSVSLRGAYWNAGIRMGLDHPLTGVGMDSYGDWYRRTRSLNAATVLPGPKTISNAAHNIFIDIFSYGGFPLLIGYLAIILVVIRSSIKFFLRTTSFNPIFVAMFTGWFGYQLQSIISINQIGLAIWGWGLGGAIVAFEFYTREVEPPTKKIVARGNKMVTSTGVFSPGLAAGIGMVLGLFVACPPLAADTKWKSALDSRDARRVEDALAPSYLNPSDSARFAQAANLLSGSNLNEMSHGIALKAVEFNKDSMDAWASLYSLPNSTSEEKSLALSNMKRLDPLNPDVTGR